MLLDTRRSYNKSIPQTGMLLQVRSAKRRVGILFPPPNARISCHIRKTLKTVPCNTAGCEIKAEDFSEEKPGRKIIQSCSGSDNEQNDACYLFGLDKPKTV